MSLLALVGATSLVIAKVFFRSNWPTGFAFLAVLILFTIGINSMLIGIVGEYVGRIYKNVKRMPVTIVEAVIDPLPPCVESPAADRTNEVFDNPPSHHPFHGT